MLDNRGITMSPQTSARTAAEQQCPLTNTDTTLPLDNGSSVLEDLPSDGDACVLCKTSSASNYHGGHKPVGNGDGRMGRASQQLEVPPMQTRRRSSSDGGSKTPSLPTNLQPPLISSDESESENDVFSRGQGPPQSTEATSSVGLASPLLTTDDESHQAPGPEDFLLDVQHDRAVSGSRQLEEDDSSLVENSTGPQSPCDDRSLKVVQDSIRGVGITKGIPRRTTGESADLDSFPNVKPRPSTPATHPAPLKRRHGYRVNRTAQIRVDEAPPSSDSESDDPDLPSPKVITLGGGIWNCMVETRTGQKFLPNGSLDELITRDSVGVELRRAFTRDKPLWDKVKLERRAERLAERICIKEDALNNGLKPIRQIFAILVLIDQASDISLFIKENLSDYDLPLSTTEDEEEQISPERRQDSSEKLPLAKLRHFQQWTITSKWSFWEMQWKVIAPVLSEGGYNDVQLLPLHEKDILPFVGVREDSSRKDVGHGGFGVVSKVSIHSRHHNFSDADLCERGFVIEEIDQGKRASFDQERNILKKFKGGNAHPHVVNLLSTFEQGNNLGLIFYRAEGDLRGFWASENSRPEVARETSTWVAKQCAGLADALRRLHNHYTFSWSSKSHEDPKEGPNSKNKLKIATAPQHVYDKPDLVGGLTRDVLPREKHSTAATKHDVRSSDGEPRPTVTVQKPAGSRKVRKYGRHGDIKPENILWYKDRTDKLGILRLTDFGVSDLKSDMSKSNIQSNVACTLAYRAPESDIGVTRQSADMWSLGCVYLEFITWLLGGQPLLTEFAKKRLSWDRFDRVDTDTFFDSHYSAHQFGKTIKLKVKDSVISFFDELHEHENCTEYIHDFLILIQDGMLVLESGKTSKSNRILSEELSSQLNRIYEKCRDKEMYTVERQQWKSIKRKPLYARKTEIEVKIPKEKSEEKPSNRYGISAMEKPGVYTLPQGHGLKDNPQTH